MAIKNYAKDGVVNKVMNKVFAAANTYSDIFNVGGYFDSKRRTYNMVISGTWVGTILVLRRFPDMKSLGKHVGSANASTITHAQTGVIYTADALIGMYISNDTDGSFGLITDNNTTTITATLAGGTDNDWDVGDEYSLWYVAGTYTANTDPQPFEDEAGVDLVALASAWTSGTAMVRISQ